MKKIKKKKEIKVADIVKATGFSRTYISRIFKKLKEDKKIFQIGKANRAKYVFVGRKDIKDLVNHEDPYVKNEEQLKQSREKILKLADYIIPGHGPIYKFEK